MKRENVTSVEIILMLDYSNFVPIWGSKIVSTSNFEAQTSASVSASISASNSNLQVRTYNL